MAKGGKKKGGKKAGAEFVLRSLDWTEGIGWRNIVEARSGDS